MTGVRAVPQKIIVFCERVDIASFVDNYTKYLRKQGHSIPDFRIVNIQKLENFPLYLDRLEKAEGFKSIEKIILIADAGARRLVTEHTIFKAKTNSFLENFNFEVFLFPKKSAAGNWTPGFMEDLLLPALKQDTSECSYFYNLYNITREYIFSVHNSRGKENHFVNYNRNFLYSYFAGTEKFVGLRLGEAAARGAFDLEHEGFKDVREFLIGLGE
jgi:hypothetical protein